MANLRYCLARAAVLTMAVILKGSHGFYVPGVRPYEFAPGEEVPMKVNALTSIHTQVSDLASSVFGRERAEYALKFRCGFGGWDRFIIYGIHCVIVSFSTYLSILFLQI